MSIYLCWLALATIVFGNGEARETWRARPKEFTEYRVNSKGRVEFLSTPTRTPDGYRIKTLTVCNQVLNWNQYYGKVHLSCKDTAYAPRRYIQILDAYFGRKSESICPVSPRWMCTDCTISNLNYKLAARCNGKETCWFPNMRKFYTDPSPLLQRKSYLRVSYKCVERVVIPQSTIPDGYHIKTLTECNTARHWESNNGKKHLSCTSNDANAPRRYIQILDAYFGRKSESICPVSPRWMCTDCTISNLNYKLAARCNGKETCWFPNMKKFYTDPSPLKQRKSYLRVTYRCVEGPKTLENFNNNRMAFMNYINATVKRGMRIEYQFNTGVRTGTVTDKYYFVNESTRYSNYDVTPDNRFIMAYVVRKIFVDENYIKWQYPLEYNGISLIPGWSPYAN